MKVHYDYGEFTIRIPLEELPKESKLALINYILSKADVDIDVEDASKLDAWVNSGGLEK